jgi:hypothetical protein
MFDLGTISAISPDLPTPFDRSGLTDQRIEMKRNDHGNANSTASNAIILAMLAASMPLLSACRPSSAPQPAAKPTSDTATTQPAAEPTATKPASAKPGATLAVVGGDFPELMIDEATESEGGAAALVKRGEDPCKKVRAKPTKALDGAWPDAVERIEFKCRYDAEQEAVTTEATATLRPDAVTLHGVPVIAVRRQASGYGHQDDYVLSAKFAERGPTLLTALQAECRKRFPGMECVPASAESADGYYLETTEIGGFRLGPDETDPQRSVYSEIVGE